MAVMRAVEPGGCKATKATAALGVSLKRTFDFALIEVRPVDGRGVELGVGRLPQEEVRETHFAGRTDDEVGVWQATGVEMSGENLFGQLFWPYSSLNGPPSRFDDLCPAAVIERDADRDAGVVPGQLNGV